jgi:hypothetical protein
MPTSRRLQYADRVALQQADQAIRKDVLRALVEIITNSNDSYARLESAGVAVKGEIVIELFRKRHNSILRVRDFAEGMDDARMDQVVGTYGEATSGIKEDKAVRGMWGRGLKDAIFGLGHGYVRSFRDGIFYSSSLLLKNNVPTFELDAPTRADPDLRDDHGILEGNGTEIEIIVSREDVKVPQFDNLRSYLSRHFELRPILGNRARRVLIRNMAGPFKAREEHALTYRPPRGEKILDELLHVEGFHAPARLELFRSNLQLSTRGEEGDYADAGLLVVSHSMVVALTMLKFENDPYASFFYGSIKVDYLHELLKNDEPVLTATRDGINWTHPFAKALKTAVEEKLEPIIQREREHALHEEQTKLDKALRRKLDKALHELNVIASAELHRRPSASLLDDEAGAPEPESAAPRLWFAPDTVYVQTGQVASLTLRVDMPSIARPGATVLFVSDSPEVELLVSKATVEPSESDPTIGIARIKVEGHQVGSEGIVSAYVGKEKAQALVQVRSKREAAPEPTVVRSGGLFSDIHFDDRSDPRQRVYLDRVNSTIVVATEAPSVSIYLDENGRLDTTVQGQVLLAELITEAVCREIARRGVETGKFLAPDGAEADAIQSHFIRLQNKYAHLIHETIVKL